MGSADKLTIAGIELRVDKPTNLATSKLKLWVIWQFPRLQSKGYQGAVRPALAGHEWLPAIIQADGNRIRVYGHVGKTYSTPEEAARYFLESNQS